MIHNMSIKFDDVTSILMELEKSNQHFYLTGSRYFNTNDEQSDYDFFCEPVARGWLEANKFVLEKGVTYKDINTVEVYKRGMVHVQVVADVKLKKAAQKWLEETGLFRLPLNYAKEHRKRLWNLAFRMVDLEIEKIGMVILNTSTGPIIKQIELLMKITNCSLHHAQSVINRLLHKGTIQ